MPSSGGGLYSTSLFSYSDPDPGRGDSSDEELISLLMEVVHLFFRGARTLILLRSLFILSKIK